VCCRVCMGSVGRVERLVPQHMHGAHTTRAHLCDVPEEDGSLLEAVKLIQPLAHGQVAAAVRGRVHRAHGQVCKAHKRPRQACAARALACVSWGSVCERLCACVPAACHSPDEVVHVVVLRGRLGLVRHQRLRARKAVVRGADAVRVADGQACGWAAVAAAAAGERYRARASTHSSDTTPAPQHQCARSV
jgi:hypothetical protein